MGFKVKNFFSDPVGTITNTASKLAGNPIGIPGFDLNMIQRPTDIGHYSPVTKGAGVIGGSLLLPGVMGGTSGANTIMPAATPGAGTAGAAAGGGALSNLAAVATILTPITALAAAAGGLSAARAARAAAAPDVPDALTAPSFGGPNTIMATRASTTEQLRRRGRASTILTAPAGEALGAA